MDKAVRNYQMKLMKRSGEEGEPGPRGCAAHEGVSPQEEATERLHFRLTTDLGTVLDVYTVRECGLWNGRSPKRLDTEDYEQTRNKPMLASIATSSGMLRTENTA